MKKTLLLMAMAAITLVSCEKGPDSDKEQGGKLEATFELTSDLPALVYGEPVEVAGTASVPVDRVTFIAAKKSGETYAEVGEAQEYETQGTDVKELFFPDSKEMTDLKVTIFVGNDKADFYFPVKKVTGEKKGGLWTNDMVKLTAVKKLDPDEGSDVGFMLSLLGVEVNGQVKHVLNINDLRETGGAGATAGFGNVISNPGGTPLGNRGLFMQRAKYWHSGTLGRGNDTLVVNGKQFRTKNADQGVNFGLYRGSWKANRKPEEAAAYKYIDSLFHEIKTAETLTNLDEIKGFYQIQEFQKTVDNKTLGVDNGTSLSGPSTIFKRTNAGTSSKAVTEELRAGDYIILRVQVTDEAEELTSYYGLMQVVQIPDDKNLLVNPEDPASKLDVTKAEELYGKSIYLDCKFQTLIHK